MVKKQYVNLFVVFTFLIVSLVSQLFAQNEKSGPQYQFTASIDLSSVKDPILQMNVDNLGYLYLRTLKKLYLYDCATVPEGAILATIELNPPDKAQFLVNNKGKMFFAKIDEIPAQIFAENGDLKAALGEMKTPEETYHDINQVFVDSRNYFILADSRKVIYFNNQGNFDAVINFERPYRIIHVDNKDNLYVLQQLIISPEMKQELEKIDNIIIRIEEDGKWLDGEIQRIRDDRDKLSEEIDALIKEKKDKYENLRELQKNVEVNKTWIDNLKTDIDNIQKKVDDTQTERETLYNEYKTKMEERKKLKTDEYDNAKDKVELLKKARENARKDEYEVLIYNSNGELVYSFVLYKPAKAEPLFNVYNIYSDEESNFFGVPMSQDSDLGTVLNPINEYKAIKGGAGAQVNIYNSNGDYVTKVTADPAFEGINYIALDGKRNLYVMDQSFSRIRKFKLLETEKK